MSDTTVQIINAETGEAIIREMTPDEITQRNKDIADSAAKKTAEATEATAKAALLKRLGLTAAEAELLLS